MTVLALCSCQSDYGNSQTENIKTNSSQTNQNYQYQNQAPYQAPYQSQQAPIAPNPYYGQPYGGYQQPSSRYYSNPYTIPPRNNQYPYYDGDQYYVPPTYYGTSGENAAAVNANQKF